MKYGTFIGAETSSGEQMPIQAKGNFRRSGQLLRNRLKEDSVIQKATVGTPSRQLCEVYNKSDNLHVNIIV